MSKNIERPENTMLFDLETTGLLRPEIANISNQPRIIEICLFILDANNKIINKQTSLIDPGLDEGVRISKEVTKNTNITAKMLRNKPKFEDFCENLWLIIASCKRIVAHNVMFDVGVLDYEFQRYGKHIHSWPELICTVEHSECLFGKRPKMSELYTFCTDKPYKQSKLHRAEYDTELLYESYLHLLKMGVVRQA